MHIGIAGLGGERVSDLKETGRGAKMHLQAVSLAIEGIGRRTELPLDGQLGTTQAEIDVKALLESLVDGVVHEPIGGDECLLAVFGALPNDLPGDVVEAEGATEGDGAAIEGLHARQGLPLGEVDHDAMRLHLLAHLGVGKSFVHSDVCLKRNNVPQR